MFNARLLFFLLTSAIVMFSGPISAHRSRLSREGGGTVILSGYDVPSGPDSGVRIRSLERAIAESRAPSPSALQSRVRWSGVEPREGQFDWSSCDRVVAALKQNRLRWAPILVIGGLNAAPGWLARKPGYKALQCVEHGAQTPIVSPWYPRLQELRAPFIKAFAERYRDSGILESVTLGLTGTDGRAALPSTDAPQSSPHLHSGLWCGDSEAERHFQVWLATKYAGSGPLRDAWGGLTQGIPYVRPFTKANASSERAWIDQMSWLADSTALWSRALLKAARAEMPGIPLYLRTSADGSPQSGCDLALQSRAAADAGAGLQVTIGAPEYRTALSRAALAASTSAEARIPLRLEAEGALSGPAINSLVYTSAASGSGALVLNGEALNRAPTAKTALQNARGFLSPRARAVEVGVFYPETSAKLLTADMAAALQPMRDRIDFDLVRESQIMPDAVSRYKAIVMLQGNVGEGRAWRDLHLWARKGGVLIYPEGMGRLLTVERDDMYHFLLFAPRPEGKDTLRAISAPHRGNSVHYRDRVVKLLASARELSAATHAALNADSEEDGVYVTGRAPNRLWLNLSTQAKTSGSRQMEPFSILAEGGGK